MISVTWEREIKKTQNHKAVGKETIGVENNKEEWSYTYVGGWDNSQNKVRLRIFTVHIFLPLSTYSTPVESEKMPQLERMLKITVLYQTSMRSLNKRKIPSSHSECLCHTPTTA